MSPLHRLALATAVLGSVALLPGCYAEAEVPTTTAADVEVEGYSPAYYDGYVVYYDDYGRPYYYNGGAVVWIGPSSPHYYGLVHHYRVYGPAYHRWYGRTGYRYHGYRTTGGYHAYRGYRGGSRGGSHGGGGSRGGHRR